MVVPRKRRALDSRSNNSPGKQNSMLAHFSAPQSWMKDVIECKEKSIFSFNFNWIFQLVRALENEVYSLSVILKGNNVIKKEPLYIVLNYLHA